MEVRKIDISITPCIRITCITLTTELGGPTNFRLMPVFAIFQQITVPSLLPVNTAIQTTPSYDVRHFIIIL